LHAPRGGIRLGSCTSCGYIYNVLFDPQKMQYTQAYENSLHFSPRFQEYAETLATKLIERYHLFHKDIIEIGCGQGDFLRLICKLGDNRGVGFDPSYVPRSLDEDPTPQTTIIDDYYSTAYRQYQADFIVCRQVLEHIPTPIDFLTNIRQTISNGKRTVIFFEVPNALFTFRDMGIWDIIYEHHSYFAPNSLRCLFSRCGFEVVDLAEEFGGQFLRLEAIAGQKPVSFDPENLMGFSGYLDVFIDNFRSKFEAWRIQLSQMAEANQRIVIWGAGSKGVTFLNMFSSLRIIQHAVDLNPRKQNMYIPGTGQKIVSPDFLRDFRPDVVLVMNPVYYEEIKQSVDKLGIAPQLVQI
jgi:SAM-dependent methyltransferase